MTKATSEAEPDDEHLLDKVRERANALSQAGEPLRWSQHHVTHPPAIVGGPRSLTGWVDVRLLDGIDRELGFNWTATISGDRMELLDHDSLDWTAPAPTAKFVLDDGSRFDMIRGVPWQLWVDKDVFVHRLLLGEASAERVGSQATELDLAPGEVDGLGTREVTFSVASNRLASSSQLRLLAAASQAQRDTGESATHLVEGAWSADRICAAIASWVYALTAVNLEVVYVEEPDLERDPDPLFERLESAQKSYREREKQAAAGADGPGGFPEGTAWVVYPSCAWLWNADNALHGEQPQHCIRPATAIETDPSRLKLPEGAPVPVARDGCGLHPSGVPVCHKHRESALAAGAKLTADPTRADDLDDDLFG